MKGSRVRFVGGVVSSLLSGRSGKLAALLMLAFSLTGCARHYVITLNNSAKLMATSKPKSDGHGWYVFKDQDGKETRVRELRVISIEVQ